ncbi:MAG: TonB family protein [Bryobacteraceae bacterium]
MTESTARAERKDPQIAAAPFYVWEAPQKSIAVYFNLDLVDRLEHDAVSSFRSISSKGSEIGGLLLGRIETGPRPMVAVEGFEPVPCEYARGPLYRLSELDKARFDAAIKRHGSSVVGFFRSHTRKGLTLEPEDVAFFDERFGDPNHVMLLVRPYATKASTAGVFIRENGQVHAESSYLEFPFTRPELMKRTVVNALPAREEKQDEAAQPVNGKPAPRAQVVPIASRREPAAPEAVETRVEPPPLPAAPEPEVEPEPAAAAPLPEPKPEPAVPVFAAAQPEPARRRWPKLLILAAALLACAVGGTFVVFPGLFSKRPPAPAAENTALALRVERNAGQLVLTWNRDTELIKTASRGVLSISDGDRKENVEIDLAQLRNGSVVYSPFTNDVSFRLEVTAAKGGNVSEYVRVLGTRPSALDPAAPEQAKAAQPAQTAPAGDGAASDAAGQNAEPEKPAQPVTPRRQFQMESLAQRLRPATPSELDAPPELGQGAAAPRLSGLPSAQPNLPPPPVQAPKPAQANGQPSYRVGGQVREAKLVSSRRPAYPPLAKQARVRGIVEIEATVGKDGRVKSVRVLNGHPLLSKAAADAVKEWIYTPSMLNGEPVEATTRVSVGFDLGN